MVDIYGMRISKFILFFMIGLLLLVAVVLIALPCVTHPVQLVNSQTESISFRLRFRDSELWSGTLEPGEHRYLPVVTDLGGSYLVLEVTPAGGRTIEPGGLYIGGYPNDGPYTYVFAIAQDNVTAFYITHPFAAQFKSEALRTVADAFLFMSRVLSCLDCSKVRIL